MNIQKIIMADGLKSSLCSGHCPTAILTENDEVIIQGYVISASESSQLEAPEGESFVKMSLDTFKKIAAQIE